MTAQELLEKVDQQLSALRALRRNGRLAHDLYSKAAVKASLQLVRAGQLEDALGILRGLPDVYYSQVQLKQMLEDPEYCAEAIEIADAIEAKQEREPEINMPGGSA